MVTATMHCMYLELYLALDQAIKDIFNFQSSKGNGGFLLSIRKYTKILSVSKRLL